MNTYKIKTDEQLLQLLYKSDEDAFTEIYERYWEQVFGIANKRLPSVEDAKEIMQNVFFAIWQKRENICIENLPVYIAAMTRYAVYRYWATDKRREGAYKKYSLSKMYIVQNETDLENKNLIEILTKLTNQLPEKHKLIFIHHKLLDKPIEEVAAELGIPTRTAEGYVLRVMKIMRRHYQKLAYTIFLY